MILFAMITLLSAPSAGIVNFIILKSGEEYNIFRLILVLHANIGEICRNIDRFFDPFATQIEVDAGWRRIRRLECHHGWNF